MTHNLDRLFKLVMPPRTVVTVDSTARAPQSDQPRDGRLSAEEAARVQTQANKVHEALGWVTGIPPLKVTPTQVVGRYAVAGFRPHQASEGAYKALLREARLLQSVLGTHDVTLTDHAGVVYVRWPLPGHRTVRLYVTALDGVVGEQDLGEPGGEWALPVGIHDLTGSRLWLDLDRHPHFLVSGGTGGGKSTFVRALIASLYRRIDPAHWRVAVLARTRKPWVGFDHMDNSWGVHLVQPGDTSVPMVDWLVGEMDRCLRSGRVSRRIFAVFDDTAGLLGLVPGLAEALTRLAPDCRQAGIHLILITQHAVADAVGGSLVLSNMGARVVGPASSAAAASLGGGRAGSAAAFLAPGQMEITAGPHKHVVAVPWVAATAMPQTDGLPDEVAPWLVGQAPLPVAGRQAAPARPDNQPAQAPAPAPVTGFAPEEAPYPAAGEDLGDLLAPFRVSEHRARLLDGLLTAEPGTLWTKIIKAAYQTRGGDSYTRASADATACLREVVAAVALATGIVASDNGEDESEGEEAGDELLAWSGDDDDAGG